MRVWSTDDILKLSSVIVHSKLQGKATRTPSPDLEFQQKHQTSVLTEVRREYPDLVDEEAMKLYYKAREARLQNDIATMLGIHQRVAGKYWGYWPNTLWLAYALRVFGSGYYPQSELVFNEAERAIQAQLAGDLPYDVVPTVEPVTESHLRELLSMLLNNHAEFYRVQQRFPDALAKQEDSISMTDGSDALARRYLAKAGILAQMGKVGEARKSVRAAKEAHAEEWADRLQHVTRHYPGLAQALQEVN